ncbi:MAG: hypothetical protein J0H74_29990 [Chitinophagaceae bacterium]|nr:hypothetical protein [Chitinophagaceae bacterium]
MENLMTRSIRIKKGRVTEEYQIEEKDYGDLVVYDIFKKGHYLMTIALDGSILFMNFDAPDPERKIFKLSFLDQFIEKIRSIS